MHKSAELLLSRTKMKTKTAEHEIVIASQQKTKINS